MTGHTASNQSPGKAGTETEDLPRRPGTEELGRLQRQSPCPGELETGGQ